MHGKQGSGEVCGREGTGIMVGEKGGRGGRARTTGMGALEPGMGALEQGLGEWGGSMGTKAVGKEYGRRGLWQDIRGEPDTKSSIFQYNWMVGF